MSAFHRLRTHRPVFLNQPDRGRMSQGLQKIRTNLCERCHAVIFKTFGIGKHGQPSSPIKQGRFPHHGLLNHVPQARRLHDPLHHGERQAVRLPGLMVGVLAQDDHLRIRRIRRIRRRRHRPRPRRPRPWTRIPNEEQQPTKGTSSVLHGEQRAAKSERAEETPRRGHKQLQEMKPELLPMALVSTKGRSRRRGRRSSRTQTACTAHMRVTSSQNGGDAESARTRSGSVTTSKGIILQDVRRDSGTTPDAATAAAAGSSSKDLFVRWTYPLDHSVSAVHLTNKSWRSSSSSCRGRKKRPAELRTKKHGHEKNQEEGRAQSKTRRHRPGQRSNEASPPTTPTNDDSQQCRSHAAYLDVAEGARVEGVEELLPGRVDGLGGVLLVEEGLQPAEVRLGRLAPQGQRPAFFLDGRDRCGSKTKAARRRRGRARQPKAPPTTS